MQSRLAMDLVLQKNKNKKKNKLRLENELLTMYSLNDVVGFS
jgi:hypothetical protein